MLDQSPKTPAALAKRIAKGNPEREFQLIVSYSHRVRHGRHHDGQSSQRRERAFLISGGKAQGIHFLDFDCNFPYFYVDMSNPEALQRKPPLNAKAHEPVPVSLY